jgi:hypothetical protein
MISSKKSTRMTGSISISIYFHYTISIDIKLLSIHVYFIASSHVLLESRAARKPSSIEYALIKRDLVNTLYLWYIISQI